MIDTHCHMEKKEYNEIEKEIDKIFGAKVKKIIINGFDLESNAYAIELANNYDNIFAAVGYHPSYLKKIREEDFMLLEQQICNKKVVAVGEIGLDYYWDRSNIEKQKDIFVRQLEIAQKYNKPVIVHNRDSVDDTYNILKNSECIGVMHCFNEDENWAEKFIKIGFLIGVGGVVTFKNATQLRDVIKSIEIKYIVLETDSPYLSPEPVRGKKNTPANIGFVASKVADIKGLSIARIVSSTTENAERIFDL